MSLFRGNTSVAISIEAETETVRFDVLGEIKPLIQLLKVEEANKKVWLGMSYDSETAVWIAKGGDIKAQVLATSEVARDEKLNPMDRIAKAMAGLEVLLKLISDAESGAATLDAEVRKKAKQKTI